MGGPGREGFTEQQLLGLLFNFFFSQLRDTVAANCPAAGWWRGRAQGAVPERPGGWARRTPFCPRGPCLLCPPELSDPLSSSLSPPRPTGENFRPFWRRRPGQPHHLHGLGGRHRAQPDYVADVSDLGVREGGKEGCSTSWDPGLRPQEASWLVASLLTVLGIPSWGCRETQQLVR